MKIVLTFLGAALLLTNFSGCVTESSDNHPQPIRPQGSGGRGDSPGYHAETSSSVSRSER